MTPLSDCRWSKLQARIRIFLLLALSPMAFPQAWSTFLHPSRAIDWTSAGFTVPDYTANCSTQPNLIPNDPGAAAANRTAIQNALASCDATHNVVNIPAGTYYVAGWTYRPQGKQVVRGAGPNATTIIATAEASCNGSTAAAVCMISSSPKYNGSGEVLAGGSQQCAWTGGYVKGTTTITLSNCGGVPPLNKMLILDQVNDTIDTGGIYNCDSATPGCTYKETSGSHNGRTTGGGIYRSQQQVVYVTGVTSLGAGSFSVTILPGVYFNNIRASQSPGAWWSGFVQNLGLEDLTLDGTKAPNQNITMYDCYQCWVRNVRSLNAGRAHVMIFQGAENVVRDSYFFQNQSHVSVSYGIDSEESSGFLVENNIFQQVTTPVMFGQGAGAVFSYNFAVNNVYTGSPGFANGAYYSHNAGNGMNLWEGNNLLGIWADNAWGASGVGTFYRNALNGWQSGKTKSTVPISLRALSRGFNIVGNVLGQPGYHNQYQAYANSFTGGVGGGKENNSIYSLGWGGTGATCNFPSCDPLVFSTLVRWGNYDVVTAGTRWDSQEAAPAASAYLNANFTPSYFNSLPHSLPASLYRTSRPSWWPSDKPWPAIGPDVTSGNLGICSGSYSGAQATATGHCGVGSRSPAWAGHANSIPAQDCYLDVMKGPPDGSGSVLSFDAKSCYVPATVTPPSPPTGLAATSN